MQFGCKNPINKVQAFFKICILLSVAFYGLSAFAIDFQQEKNSKYLRWLLKTQKDQIIVTKNDNWVLLETFEISVFEQLKSILTNNKLDEGYFKSLKFTKEYFPERPAQIQLFLKDNSIELFKFYQSEDQKLVLDFWINPEVKVTSTENSQQVKVEKNIEEKIKEDKVQLVTENSAAKDQKIDLQASIDKVSSWNSTTDKSKDGYRDFRYGATIIWPYKAIIPASEVDIQLGSKAPEYYAPVQTPNSIKDERESILQLVLNFYKKEKYGLMKKTMDLFQQKFKPTEDEKIFFSYIEANTLYRSILNGGSNSLLQGAMARLEDMLRLTQDYKYQKVCYRFLIQYAINKENFQRALELAKDFYIRSNENRDREMIYLSTKTILYTLAQLNQVDKLDQFLNDSYVSKWLDTQEGISYKIYSLFKRQEYQKVLATYERLEKSLSKPLEGSINFHIAESYFQIGEIEKAQKMFDEFIKNHSFMSQSSFARVRIALISEIQEEPVDKISAKYLEAIDKATLAVARIEAKIRYVAVAYNRKQVVTDSDKMILGFLDFKDDEKPSIVGDAQLLLWQTRLRTFLTANNYSDALTYYSTLPVDSMIPIIKKIFEQDGTEVVLGLMQQAYLRGDHAKVVKIWGIYQEKMGKHLKNNKQALYYVGTSTMHIGLKNNSEVLLQQYTTAKDQYPQWIKRDYAAVEDESIIAKQLAHSQKWIELEKHLEGYKKKDAIFTWSKVQLLISKNDYKNSQSIIENALTDKNLLKDIAPAELNELIEIYLSCLEKTEKADRLQKRIEAIIAVLNPKNEVFKETRERAKFLLLESYFTEKNKTLGDVDTLINEFEQYYPKSTYLPRIKFGKALFYFSQKKKEEGSKILNDLIKNATTPMHIKEMAKSELSSLSIP